MQNFSHLSKQQARQTIKQIISTLPKEYFFDSGQKICKTLCSLSCYQQADAIFSYVSTNTEPSTFLLLEQALKDNKRLAVPKTYKNGTMEAIVIHSLSELSVGQFGILEPQSGESLSPNQIDFSLIPCMSMSLTGQRLGYGGGYYDRFLSQLSNRNFAAACCGALLTHSLPIEPHDQAIPLILTERSLLFCTH